MPHVPKVLIVDDEPANRRLLSDLVAREGFTVLTAPGGAEALETLGRETVDLVLLDLMMPGVDGMAVLAELSRQGALPALPVVVVTAHEDRKVRIDALTAGAIDFLAKPLDRLEVRCKIRTLIELGRLRRHAGEVAAHRATAALHARVQRTIAGLPLCLYMGRLTDEVRVEVEWVLGDVERVTGLSHAEYMVRGASAERVHPEDRPALQQLHDHLSSGALTEWRTRYRTRHPLRGDVWVLNVGTYDRAENVVMGATLDVSAEKNLEDSLIHAQKMDAMGQLAGGVAHDFNNILAVILSYGSFIEESLPAGDPRRDDITEVMKAGDRAAALTRQLLAFSRQLPTEKRPVDLNGSLAQVHKFLTRTLGAHIALHVVPSARPAVVRIDPVQFDQISMNFAVNARDAMPQGGHLRISLEHPPRDPASSGPGWVHVKFADSGVGMDESTQKRIFEPFFTTKERGKGTGLGLATCFGIVADAGGTIRVESAVGRGTTFTVALPLCDEDATSEVTESRRAPRVTRGETVLVAEDDAALRRVAERVLTGAGYTVHLASNGHEAIRKLDELGASLDVLVSDVVMPGRSGHEVVEHAQRVAPHAAMLLTSGFLDLGAERGTGSDVPILWKPVPPPELIRAVEEALRERSARATGPATPPPTAPNRGSVRPSAAPPRGRVLLVEEDEALARAGGRLLSEHFEVSVSRTLEATRLALREAEIDVLVLDLELPEGASLELLREARAPGAELPVILVTGALSGDAARLALRSRVCEHLPKPFPPADLLLAVRAAMETARTTRRRSRLLASRPGGDELVKQLPCSEQVFAQALLGLRMVFQPIVRAADGSIFGYEALLRCDEPALSTPRALLAAAEVLDRVGDVGRVVRATVAEAMLAERDRLEAIFVHLHPSEVRASVLAEASDPLLGVAQRVVLEITRWAPPEGERPLADELARIRSLGYRLALDNLGEDEVALVNWIHMAPDVAKIHRSLVRDIERRSVQRDLVAALVHVARRSGIVVIAEGVETAAERDTLVDLGCDLLQGHLFAEPGPAFPGAAGGWGG